MRKTAVYLFTFAAIILSSCNNKVGRSLFKNQSPHRAYEQRLKDAGLEGTALFKKWSNAARLSLQQPVSVSVPYKEKAYFGPEQAGAVAYAFDAQKGEKLHVQLSVKSLDSTQLFVDMFKMSIDTMAQHEYLESSKPGERSLTYTIDESGKYLIRIQPELLTSASYELEITAGPSLSNPVAATAKQSISSLFGVGRDAGARKHEGVDIFAARATPAVAAADGVISRVGTNNLGGKVVFLRPENRGINLYYAHLDSQLVVSGQRVTVGDTIGLIGNTGNAITTAPHLHFGIYTANGAVDPLPFIKSSKMTPSKIMADVDRIGNTVRIISRNNKLVSVNTPGVIEAAAQNGYRVIFPDQTKVFIPQKEVSSLKTAINIITTSNTMSIYKEPDELAAVLTDVVPGTKLPVIGHYKGFFLVERDEIKGWIRQ